MGKLTGVDIALTGVPRGGTTLCCQLLQQSLQTVALFEPIDVASLPGDPGLAVEEVLRFYAEIRQGILRDGLAPSKQVDGRVPDNPFSTLPGKDGTRRLLAAPGQIRVASGLPDNFTLVIKHNAAFTALLPLLSAKLKTIAIVRNPLSVLGSWNSVDLPVSSGRIPAAERLDPKLASALHAQPDRLERQLLVLEWFFGRFERELAPKEVLRYEDIVASQGATLRLRAGVAGTPEASSVLTDRNRNSLYARNAIPALAEALERRAGSWQRWYPPSEIRALATGPMPGREGDPRATD